MPLFDFPAGFSHLSPPPDPFASPAVWPVAAAYALCRRAAYANGSSFEDLWERLRLMPPHVLPLLDSPAGWAVLSIDLGAPLPIAVH